LPLWLQLAGKHATDMVTARVTDEEESPLAPFPLPLYSIMAAMFCLA
jgi:hypothetical protein